MIKVFEPQDFKQEKDDAGIFLFSYKARDVRLHRAPADLFQKSLEANRKYR